MFGFHPYDLIIFSVFLLLIACCLGFVGFIVYVGLSVVKKNKSQP